MEDNRGNEESIRELHLRTSKGFYSENLFEIEIKKEEMSYFLHYLNLVKVASTKKLLELGPTQWDPYAALRKIHTEQKRKQKRKLSLILTIYSLIFSLIFHHFAFAAALTSCE